MTKVEWKKICDAEDFEGTTQNIMMGDEEKFSNASLNKEVSTRVFSELNINSDGILKAESDGLQLIMINQLLA